VLTPPLASSRTPSGGVAGRLAPKDDRSWSSDADGWSRQVTADRPTGGRERPRGVALGRLRRHCQAKLQELHLDLPVPLTTEAFCQALGVRLGRQIVPCPVDTRTGPCGLWVATATADYFFYERATTRLHQLLIVSHEAGHRVFDHHSADVMYGELAGLLGLNVDLVRRVLGRTSYTTTEEQEAEVFGRLIVERAGGDSHPASRPATAEAAIVGRLESALEAPPKRR
jgi:hypothetical protein